MGNVGETEKITQRYLAHFHPAELFSTAVRLKFCATTAATLFVPTYTTEPPCLLVILHYVGTTCLSSDLGTLIIPPCSFVDIWPLSRKPNLCRQCKLCSKRRQALRSNTIKGSFRSCTWIWASTTSNYGEPCKVNARERQVNTVASGYQARQSRRTTGNGIDCQELLPSSEGTIA